MENKEIMKLLAVIAGCFQQFAPNENTLPTWSLILKSVPYEEGYKAIIAYVREGHAFAPNPGQILKIIKDCEALKVPLAEDVWQMVIECAKNGRLSEEIEANTLFMNAIRSVGFDRVRLADLESELPFVRRDFIEYYNRSLERIAIQNEMDKIDNENMPAYIPNVTLKEIQ